MKKFSFLLLAIFVIATTTEASAADYEIYECGKPVSSKVITPNYKFCNIYERQLAYRTKRMELNEQLKARQAAFAEPSLEAYRQYREKLDELHDSYEE